MNFRLWSLIHKWTSLVCTIFLLLLCLTGLPLIFHEEIEHLSGETKAPTMPAGTPNISLDRIADVVREQRPSDVIRYMFWDDEEHPHMRTVSMASAMNAPSDEAHYITADSRTGDILQSEPSDRGFMYLMFKLHVDMFAGLPGMLFLGFMGLLFAVAIVSGIVLYHPFMRRLDFGTVRRQRTQLKWLDLHNLFGVVTIAWALTVGITGAVNTLSPIVMGAWQNGQMAEMIAPYKNAPPLKTIGSVQAAVDTAMNAVPGMQVRFIAFPGTDFSSPHHYTVFLKGDTPLTARLMRPVLVDAKTGELTDTREMPWYVKTLLLSQPLHFGDYAGMGLKIIWALLDIITIIVLGSGLYLWLKKRNRRNQEDDLLELAERVEA